MITHDELKILFDKLITGMRDDLMHKDYTSFIEKTELFSTCMRVKVDEIEQKNN